MFFKIIFPILLVFGLISLFFISESHDSKEKTSEISANVSTVLSEEQLRKSKEINDYFTKRSKVNGFNGAVLFAEKGKIIFEEAFGYSNLKEKTKMNLDTKFEIASASKPFTSYAIMLLKQKGELSIEDSVQQYFPKFPYKGITIKLLMIHKSGLPEYLYFTEDLWKDKSTPITNMDVVNLLIKEHPQRYFLPDKKYNYVNTNYCLLAAIVEKITGDSFEEFVTEEIFDPLEMTNTFLNNSSKLEDHNNIATGYKRGNQKAENTYLNGVVGDKGIYTTVEDMLKFDQALYSGSPLELKILEEAFEPAHERLLESDNYGYGWRINAADGTNKIVYHTGWWKGFRSYFIRELGKKKTIIVLSNFSQKSKFSTKELIELFN